MHTPASGANRSAAAATGSRSASRSASGPAPARQSRRGSGNPVDAADTPDAPAAGDDAGAIVADLSFREAQTALELSLAELQNPDLEIERMASLHERARRYADRCERLLQQVEHEVMQWDPEHPEADPVPYEE